MKVEVKDAGGWKRELHIEMSDEEVRNEMKTVLKEFRRKAELPGFRKGKVPESVIEQRFGDYLEEQLHNRVIPKAYREALEETDLDPVGPGEISDFKYQKGTPLTFVAHIEIRPEITLDNLDDFKLVKRIFEVPDSEVETTLAAIADQNADYEPVDRAAQATDRVKISVVDDGENSDEPEETTVTIGTEDLLPEFDEALTGAKVGEDRTVTVQYPEDMSSEALRGQSREFQLQVLEIAEKKVPEIDDNLAEKLGFDDLDDLRGRIRLRLEGEELLRAERELEDTLIRQVIQRHDFEAPEAMVNNLMDRLIEDVKVPEDKRDEFRESQREAAARTVKRMLILNAIRRDNDLTVSDDEVEAAIREGFEDEREAAKAVADAKKSGDFNRHQYQMSDRKAIDWLLDKAEVEEVTAPRPPLPQGAEAMGPA